MKPKQLIPDHHITVVLDTSSVRDLALVTVPPSWAKTFSEMARDEYSFSLADAAAAELLNQERTGATSLAAHQHAIERQALFQSQKYRSYQGKWLSKDDRAEQRLGCSHSSLNHIDSFQKAWFIPPDRLANEWLAGNKPQPGGQN